LYYGHFSSFVEGKPTLKLILQSLCCLLLSWLVAALVVVVAAVVIQSLGRAMSWYSHPLLILPLYALPTFITVAAIHSYWVYQVSEGGVIVTRVHKIEERRVPYCLAIETVC
jgi:hypothetical protein